MNNTKNGTKKELPDAIMIVYSDPSYEIEFSVLVAQLQARTASVCAVAREWRRGEAVGEDVLDALRSLLIFAGQVEQAIQDAALEVFSSKAKQVWCQQCEAWTDVPAIAFAATLSRIESIQTEAAFASARRLHFPDGDFQPLSQLERLLSDGFQSPACEIPAIRLNVKMPEGFAFYALYPEQYAASVRRWTAEHAPNTDDALLILGIRSIGTGLSALVAADLRSYGRRTLRYTVRPTGPPYARQTKLPAERSTQQTALIVDEGPGMSGSSMASAAQALMEAGIKRDRIAFLPAHGGEPGGHGDAATRGWWETTPRYATPLDATRWNGLALPDVLAARTSALYAERIPVTHVETCGGGLWRRTAYASEEEWPAVCAAFERPKYLCTLENGERVLWKFAGLATGENGKPQDETLFVSLTKRGKAGWTSAPLGRAMGFVAFLWIAGTLLTCADADADTLVYMARYLVAVAGPPLPEEAHGAAIARMADMLYWNTWEALGEAIAARTRQWSEAAAVSDWIKRARSYGDGRPGPHEWLRTPPGNLLKTDSGGHDSDHTIVGKQCYVWDVAGAIVEWRLDSAAIKLFTEAVQQATGEKIPADALTFYRLAYAAFRIGQTSLCAQISGHDPAEQIRLWRAYDLYKNALLAALQTGEKIFVA